MVSLAVLVPPTRRHQKFAAFWTYVARDKLLKSRSSAEQRLVVPHKAQRCNFLINKKNCFKVSWDARSAGTSPHRPRNLLTDCGHSSCTLTVAFSPPGKRGRPFSLSSGLMVMLGVTRSWWLFMIAVAVDVCSSVTLWLFYIAMV